MLQRFQHLVLELFHGAEKEGALHVKNFHAFRNAEFGRRTVFVVFLVVVQQLVFNGGNVADLGHAAHEEQGGEHHTHLHGHDQVHKDGQQEGDYQHRRILPRPFQQAAERVHFAHVVAHHRQDARQHGQGNLLRVLGKGHQDGKKGHRVNHAGNRAFGPRLDVGSGAGDGPGGRNAAEQGGPDVADSLGNEFHIGFVASSRHAVRHGGAQQGFNRRQQGDGEGRSRQRSQVVPFNVGQ